MLALAFRIVQISHHDAGAEAQPARGLDEQHREIAARAPAAIERLDRRLRALILAALVADPGGDPGTQVLEQRAARRSVDRLRTERLGPKAAGGLGWIRNTLWDRSERLEITRRGRRMDREKDRRQRMPRRRIPATAWRRAPARSRCRPRGDRSCRGERRGCDGIAEDVLRPGDDGLGHHDQRAGDQAGARGLRVDAASDDELRAGPACGSGRLSCGGW